MTLVLEQTPQERTGHALDSAMQASANVVLHYQQPSGAYPASPNFATYHYSWLRDGAFIADGMSRAGYVESAERFFEWCARIVLERREHILNGGLLDARYTYDGQESTEEWGNFQLDGYGTLLWAMVQHAARHERSIGQYQEAAGLIQHYLATHWQEPCIDWWEERTGHHAASLACVYAGLQAYEHPEAAAVKAAINPGSERTDASLLVCALFDAVSAEEFAPTLARIESELVAEDGGVYRYRDDTYYGGGTWPLLTSLLGWYYAKLGRTAEAEQKLEWNIAQMQDNGWLAEQSQAHLLHPEEYEPWVEKWGNPANPLLWSQAMFLTLASELKNSRAS